MADLARKVALVTGASRGIGAAVARELARCGAAVAVNYAGSKDAADALVNEIVGQGGRAMALRADVSVPEQARALVEQTISELGGLDVLVNNAGIARDGLLVRMSDEDWDAVIATNLTGVFTTTRAAAKHMMKARAGSIVNITSVVGLVGNAGQANYAAAKAGVIALTRSVAREWARFGVTVNAVAPGYVETRLTAARAGRDDAFGIPPDIRDALLARIPVGRGGTPQDVAHAVAFFCSPLSGYVTGQVLEVDGGMPDITVTG